MHLPPSQDIPFYKQLECDVAESCCLTWPGQKCLNDRKGPFLKERCPHRPPGSGLAISIHPPG